MMSVAGLRKYILFTRSGLRHKQNESPVTLCIPCYPRPTQDLLDQLFFQRFDVAAFMLVERPLMQIYSTSVFSGVVIGVSYSGTTITPVVESLVQYHHTTHLDLGMKECETYLTHIIQLHYNLVAAISEGDTYTEEQLYTQLLELTLQIWRDGDGVGIISRVIVGAIGRGICIMSSSTPMQVCRGFFLCVCAVVGNSRIFQVNRTISILKRTHLRYWSQLADFSVQGSAHCVTATVEPRSMKIIFLQSFVL